MPCSQHPSFLPNIPAAIANIVTRPARSLRFQLPSKEQQRVLWPATAGPFFPLASVQLSAGRWVVRNGRGEVTKGGPDEDFVGKTPLLRAGTLCRSTLENIA